MKKGFYRVVSLVMTALISLSLTVGMYAAPPQELPAKEELAIGESALNTEAEAASGTDIILPAAEEGEYDIDGVVSTYAKLKEALQMFGELSAAEMSTLKVRFRLDKSFEIPDTIFLPDGINLTITSEGSSRKIMRMSGSYDSSLSLFRSNHADTKLTLNNVSIEGLKEARPTAVTSAASLVEIQGGTLTLKGNAQLAYNHGIAIEAGSALKNTVINLEDCAIHSNGFGTGNAGGDAAISLTAVAELNIRGPASTATATALFLPAIIPAPGPSSICTAAAFTKTPAAPGAALN